MVCLELTFSIIRGLLSSLFPGIDQALQQQEVHTKLLMGGYCPEGVAEIPPICEAEELNGLPLGHMGERILYMVWWSLSL